MKASSIQRASIVRGIERLIIMDHGRYKTTSLEKNQLMSAGCWGRYWILNGLRKDDSDSESDDCDEDDGLYRRTPVRIVESIMREKLHRDLRAEGLEVEDGGGVPLGCWRKINIHLALKATFSGSRRASKLAFVFDFANGDTSFDELRFLHDAGREPLCFRDLDQNAFEAVYGLPRKLTFSS